MNECPHASNSRHQEWERETENCLSLFQDLEEGRIALLRDSLWKVTNIVSSHSVVDDSGSEQVRHSQNIQKETYQRDFRTRSCVPPTNHPRDIDMVDLMQVRVALERGELSECLEGFVAEYATGSKRPEPIAYENLPTSDSDGLGKASQVT